MALPRLVRPPPRAQSLADLPTQCPDCHRRIASLILTLYAHSIAMERIFYKQKGFNVTKYSPFVVTTDDCCIEATVEEKSNGMVDFLDFKCADHSALSTNFITIPGGTTKMENYYSLEDAEFVPNHPGIELGFVLTAMNKNSRDFAEAVYLSEEVAKNILNGDSELTDSMLENAKSLLMDAWQGVKESKVCYDYYQSNGKLPSSQILESFPR